MCNEKMDALRHLQTLKFFKEATPYMILEAMSFLFNGNRLGPLWLEFEKGVCEKWQVSEVNKGWAW